MSRVRDETEQNDTLVNHFSAICSTATEDEPSRITSSQLVLDTQSYRKIVIIILFLLFNPWASFIYSLSLSYANQSNSDRHPLHVELTFLSLPSSLSSFLSSFLYTFLPSYLVLPSLCWTILPYSAIFCLFRVLHCKCAPYSISSLPLSLATVHVGPRWCNIRTRNLLTCTCHSITATACFKTRELTYGILSRISRKWQELVILRVLYIYFQFHVTVNWRRRSHCPSIICTLTCLVISTDR